MFSNNYFTAFQFRIVIDALEDRKAKLDKKINISTDENLKKSYKIQIYIINQTLQKIRNSHTFT